MAVIVPASMPHGDHGMKIAIVGSRNYPNKQDVVRYVKSLPHGTMIISGGAMGPDTWAEEAALVRGLETMIFKPEWDKWGKSAGFRRNADIVMAADKVVAFTTGSKGTANTMELARRYGKELEVHRAKTEEKKEQRRLL